MKIGIAGYGHVGRAYAAVLQNYHETEIIDPKHYDKKISSDVDAVVICVSTPKGLAGACNMLHVTDVLEDCPDVPILIKSTISVQGWSYINDKFDKKIAYCPEFLRADKALDDIRQQEHIMIGGKEVSFWIKLFKEIFPSCPHIITANPEELLMGVVVKVEKATYNKVQWINFSDDRITIKWFKTGEIEKLPSCYIKIISNIPND